SNGSTSTPPSAGAMRTSRPSKTRYSAPSSQRFAPSGPNARKRSVVSAKSNGSGKRSSKLAEVRERLVGDAFAPEVAREPVAGEDAGRGTRGAAVGEAVAHVLVLPPGLRAALPRLPAAGP